MKKKTSQPKELTTLQQRVERSLIINRTAKINFPGLFMGVYGRITGGDSLTLEFDGDPVFHDHRGDLNWASLGVLIDIALGSVTRVATGPGFRSTTLHLDVELTGASSGGHLVTEAQFVGRSDDSTLKQLICRGLVRSGDKLVASATGQFITTPVDPSANQVQFPWIGKDAFEAAIAPTDLDDAERAALTRCLASEKASTEQHSFIEHFWCGVPRRGEGRASLTVPVTPHLGNRVGNVHGGLLLGTAAGVASAALPHTMRLANISAWYVSRVRGRS